MLKATTIQQSLLFIFGNFCRPNVIKYLVFHVHFYVKFLITVISNYGIEVEDDYSLKSFF